MRLAACLSLMLAVGALSACATPPLAAVSPTSLEAGFGQRNTLGGYVITPLAIVEDSRCPASVQCIQAGTVRIRVEIARLGTAPATAIVGLNAPADIGSAWLHLQDACPGRATQAPITTSDYRFRFVLAPVATVKLHRAAAEGYSAEAVLTLR